MPIAPPTGHVQAIETEYAGCRFRSRLEARWAVVFDQLDINWQYEPEGLDINGVRYLPDFYLPSVGAYAEVKGRMDPRGMEKVFALARARPSVLVLGDIPRPDVMGPHFIMASARRGGPLQGWQVSLLQSWDGPFVAMPFGFPIDIPDPASLDDLKAWCDFINDGLTSINGWIRTPQRVADAYTAGRSARFEFGEMG